MSKLLITLDLQDDSEEEVSHTGTTLELQCDGPRGNNEREAVFRAVVAVDKALDALPDGHGQVAGWLMAKGWKGDTRTEDNALARYLADAVRRSLIIDSQMAAMEREHDKIKVCALGSGTIVESPKYMVCLEPKEWQSLFFQRLPEFKQLIS